jgi:hypothetical protein
MLYHETEDITSLRTCWVQGCEHHPHALRGSSEDHKRIAAKKIKLRDD